MLVQRNTLLIYKHVAYIFLKEHISKRKLENDNKREIRRMYVPVTARLSFNT